MILMALVIGLAGANLLMTYVTYQDAIHRNGYALWQEWVHGESAKETVPAPITLELEEYAPVKKLGVRISPNVVFVLGVQSFQGPLGWFTGLDWSFRSNLIYVAAPKGQEL
jgi:hypothetical protein